jgi:DNA-binding GntR family transcriptional regulator
MTNKVANLDEHVRETLRTNIISGDLIGGTHLSELKLSKEFNVSRTPVREALCALAADGLIEMVPHRGAFVRTIDTSEKSDQHYVYNQLMGMAARIAVERSGIESLMEIENLVSAIPSENITSIVKACEDINMFIRKQAQSPSLEASITAVERRMTSAPMWLDSEENITALKQEYTYLLGAFKRQKADVAEKTMRQVMTWLSQWTEETTEETSMIGATTTTSTTTETPVLNA